MHKYTKKNKKQKQHNQYNQQEQIIFYAFVPSTKKQHHTPSKQNNKHRYKKRYTYINLKQTSLAKKSSFAEFCEYTNAPITKHALFQLFYFVHITKTAGVALKKCLQEQCALPTMSTYAPQNMLLQGKPIMRNKKKYPSYTRFLSRGHLTVNDIDPRIQTLCILREPMSRVRSAFRFLSEGGKHGEVWDYPERAMMELFKKHNITSLSDIFELKNNALKKRILEHPHFRPQCEFICAPNTLDVLVDHVFVLETFDAKEVSNVLNIRPFQMEQRNKSEIKYSLSAKDKKYIQGYYKKDLLIYQRYV